MSDKLHLPRHIQLYLRKRAVSAPWRIEGHPSGPFSGTVVIPSLAESANLPLTLGSLASNPPSLLSRFLILIVVNHRADASLEVKSDNAATLASLPVWKQQYGLENLRWVDAVTDGKELPPKQGVGLARKLGLDLALSHLNYQQHDPLLVCLDADTLVQNDYLEAISGHFAQAPQGGAVIPYCHRKAGDPQGQAAIDRYELFLRTYVLGLELAGSPYAFHTVGSAMACRASAYTACGGMNRRLAGEDFYFLQQLHKTSGVAQMSGTCVYPSPRGSWRVPFGTGRAVGDMLAEGEERLQFYQPGLFTILGDWLKCVAEKTDSDGGELLCRAAGISSHLYDYLEQAGFSAAWDNLRQHNPDGDRRLAAFHCWFDAFRTMRLMHHLTERAFPRIPPEQAVPPLMEPAGLGAPATIAGMLERLRTHQGKD